MATVSALRKAALMLAAGPVSGLSWPTCAQQIAQLNARDYTRLNGQDGA